jgi:hypothetical protein
VNSYGDYIVYADESGDHNLVSIDQAYPVFVLSCCIFNKKEYAARVVPALKELKFDIFGHDAVIFHEREIRQQEGPFNILRDRDFQQQFYEKMNSFVETMPVNVVACAIKKYDLRQRYFEPDSPYHLALGLCLERIATFLTKKNQQDKIIHLIVESRGKKEDDELELEFLRVVKHVELPNKLSFRLSNIKFSLKFVSKQANMAGKQIADLIARPIGRYVIDPSQENRAVEIIKKRISANQWRLKIFP